MKFANFSCFLQRFYANLMIFADYFISKSKFSEINANMLISAKLFHFPRFYSPKLLYNPDFSLYRLKISSDFLR